MSSQLRPPGRLRRRRTGATLLSCMAVLAFLAAGVSISVPAYAVGAPAQPALTPQDSAANLPLAATGYTYWGYFSWDASSSKWKYATVGPNDKSVKPEDGDVYGFHWALQVGLKSREPRADGDFEAICGSAGGGSHVAFVIDYGTTEDAPDGEQPPEPQGVCADQRDGFTVQQTLQSVVAVRTDGGLLCGVDDYPSSGCGDTIKDAEKPAPDEPVVLRLPGDSSSGQTESSSAADSAASDDGDDSNQLLTIGVPVLLVVALGVGALVLRRRRS